MAKLPPRIEVFRTRIGLSRMGGGDIQPLIDIGKPVALSSAAKTVRKSAAPKPAPAEWPPAGLAKPAHRAVANAKIASLKLLAASAKRMSPRFMALSQAA